MECGINQKLKAYFSRRNISCFVFISVLRTFSKLLFSEFFYILTNGEYDKITERVKVLTEKEGLESNVSGFNRDF